jgi:hypothetical protein
MFEIIFSTVSRFGDKKKDKHQERRNHGNKRRGRGPSHPSSPLDLSSFFCNGFFFFLLL